MRVAEAHEARALGIFHHAALERDGAQFVGLSAARPHVLILDRHCPAIAGRAPRPQSRVNGASFVSRGAAGDKGPHHGNAAVARRYAGACSGKVDIGFPIRTCANVKKHVPQKHALAKARVDTVFRQEHAPTQKN